MKIKTRNLGLEIYYLFNGKDLIINENLSDSQFQDILHLCEENFPDRFIKKTRDGIIIMERISSCRYHIVKD